MANSTLSVPSMSKKVPSAPGLSVLSPAPSLLSLRSVIEHMPNNIRLRYKDAAKYTIWPECPLDTNGNAVELNEEDELAGSTSGLGGLKIKRNLTMVNGTAIREYSKFGNAPVTVEAALKPPSGRFRRTSESTSGAGYAQSFSPIRSRKPQTGAAVAYFSSKVCTVL